MTTSLARIPIRVEPEVSPSKLLTSQLWVESEISARSPVLNHPVTFLIDTGAAFTVLHHMDAINMGIEPRKLPRLSSVRTASGLLEIGYVENVALSFETDTEEYGSCVIRLPAIGVAILPRTTTPTVKTMPSLLGMDVISCLALIVDTQAEMGKEDDHIWASMEVYQAGPIHVIPVPKSD